MAADAETHNWSTCQEYKKSECSGCMGCWHHTPHKAQGLFRREVGGIEDLEMGLTTSKQCYLGSVEWMNIQTHGNCNSMHKACTLKSGKLPAWRGRLVGMESTLTWRAIRLGGQRVCTAVFFKDVILARLTTSQGRSHIQEHLIKTQKRIWSWVGVEVGRELRGDGEDGRV